MENAVCCVSNACPSRPRRVPHGETSRREAMGQAAEVVAPSSLDQPMEVPRGARE
jgi:hypothetical protein